MTEKSYSIECPANGECVEWRVPGLGAFIVSNVGGKIHIAKAMEPEPIIRVADRFGRGIFTPAERMT